MFEKAEKSPEELTAASIMLAVGVHLALFLVFWGTAKYLQRPKETIIPLDLTVVVQENLDGRENEPPPLDKPQPPPEPPKPKVTPPPEPPKPAPQEKVPEAVEQIREKKHPDPPPKINPKPPEKPKKTAQELREERLQEMRNRTKKVDPKTLPKPQPDGKTGKKTLSDAEIAKRLREGYRPGSTEQLAESEEARCFALIKRAIDQKWTQLSPAIGQSGSVLLYLEISAQGAITAVSLARSCGDRTSDQAAVAVVRAVGTVRGLTSSFLKTYAGRRISVQYDITGGR